MDYKESWSLKNWCFWTLVLEKTLESALGSKVIKSVNPKWNQSWIFNGRTDWCWNSRSNTLATWWEELTHCKIQWCWERLKAEGQGDDRGWDSCMVLPTQWTWVWASSRSWWWTVKPSVLQSVGSERVRHDWATELNNTLKHSVGAKVVTVLDCWTLLFDIRIHS